MAKIIYRQGDVILEKIDKLPLDIINDGNEIRVKGETGNDHVISGRVFITPKIKTNMPFQKFIEVGTGGALIVHTDTNPITRHPDLNVPEGIYVVRKERSATYNVRKYTEVLD